MPTTPLEVLAVVSYAASTLLLARNRPLGWWLGLVGVAAYGVVFYEARLFAEVGLQLFYFVTSLQAIYLWRHGGPAQREKRVGRATRRVLLLALAACVVGTVAVYYGLVALQGAAPFWDALAAVVSIAAHLLLMARHVESWYLWIFVDAIYVPLYASRGLYLTALLYVAFLAVAIQGLATFRRLYRDHRAITQPVQ